MTTQPTALPESMRALRFAQFGTPAEVLTNAHVPLPPVTPGESLVRVEAAGINPSDIAMVAGRFGSELPATPGRDFAGVVVAGPRAGEEVWGSGVGFGVTRPGTDAEYVAVPDAWLSRKPATLSMGEAAAVPLPYCIAWLAVVKTGAIAAGQAVLIVGGSGAVGQAATDIAMWKGAKVIVADQVRPSPSVPYVSTAENSFEADVLRMTQPDGVDLVLDMVGGPLLGPALTTLREAGHYVLIASPGGTDATLDAAAFYRRRLRLTGVNMTAVSGPQVRDILDELTPGFETGALSAPTTRAWPLTEAKSAFEAVAAGSDGSKQILLPGEEFAGITSSPGREEGTFHE
jgi:NADPH2:quinone reductase